MDWRRASSQILRALRGKRSQLAFSRRLGYRSNVACDWEAGRRLPTAAETLRACERVGVKVDAAFGEFQPTCAASLRDGNRFRIDRWLKSLAGSTTITELAARSQFSRFAIARWMRGKTQPRLHDFLAIVEAVSGRASDLVNGLVPIEAVEELRAIHAQRVAAKRLAFDEPWSEAVLRVMETVGYRKSAVHRSGYIAARLGIEEEKEVHILTRLEQAGIIRLENGRYLDLTPLTVDTRASSTDMRRLKSHWTEVCLERIKTPRDGDWLGYNVVSANADDLERIRQVLRSAYREIRAIAVTSEPAQCVALLNFQLVTWNEE
jgi:transcriptional regulator with XRE-family HTH domain